MGEFPAHPEGVLKSKGDFQHIPEGVLKIISEYYKHFVNR